MPARHSTSNILKRFSSFAVSDSEVAEMRTCFAAYIMCREIIRIKPPAERQKILAAVDNVCHGKPTWRDHEKQKKTSLSHRTGMVISACFMHRG